MLENVLSCDECQRVGNISRRNEMPMSYTLVIEEFNCWGFDFRDFYPRAPGSLVVLSFLQPLNFSSVFPSF
jgi:hypothetical protein